jgi:hypothetical protein
MVGGNNDLRLIINMNPAATGISYILEVTDDLGNWTSAGTVAKLDTWRPTRRQAQRRNQGHTTPSSRYASEGP